MNRIKRFLYTALIGVLCFMCVFCFTGCDYGNYIKGRKYDTIEELHADFVYETDRQAEESLDYHARELIDYFQIEDKWFMFSTYSRDGVEKELVEGYLYVKSVRTKDGKFMIEEPYMADVALHSDYDDLDYDGYYASYVIRVKLNGKKKAVGFAYKPKDADYDLYFDGVKMQTREVINPFTGETFDLCYAVSPKNMRYINVLFRLTFDKEANIHVLEKRPIAN